MLLKEIDTSVTTQNISTEKVQCRSYAIAFVHCSGQPALGPLLRSRWPSVLCVILLPDFFSFYIRHHTSSIRLFLNCKTKAQVQMGSGLRLGHTRMHLHTTETERHDHPICVWIFPPISFQFYSQHHISSIRLFLLVQENNAQVEIEERKARKERKRNTQRDLHRAINCHGRQPSLAHTVSAFNTNSCLQLHHMYWHTQVYHDIYNLL